MRKFKTVFEQLPTPVSIAVLLVIIVIVITTSWTLYNHTVDILTQNLRDRLQTISVTQAANVDASDIEALQVEEDWKKPEWEHLVSKLHKAKYSNGQIVFIYIFRKTKDDPTKMEFVADADSIDPYANINNNPTGEIVSASTCPLCVDSNRDGKIDREHADRLQWPGMLFPEIEGVPEAFAAYNGPITVPDIYTDEYGSVLTGFAPITNASGTVVAILGTDIKADDFLTITRQTLYPFLAFIAALTLIIAVLAASLIYIWSRRANMLARLSRSLEIANAQQEGLLHFISHEIKGYLTNSEAGFASIAEGDYGEVTPQLKTMATSALANVRRGVSTVVDILRAADMKRGTVSYRKDPVDVRAVVENVINTLRPNVTEKGLTLETNIADGSYTTSGDEEKLRNNVLRNLIDNAIRYTPTGTITISLSNAGGTIRFSVKDSGVGITEEDKKRLFTEGGHGKESIKTNVHSTGYGLFIAKQVVDAHGGKIWAESEGEGKGSTFVVELPTA